MSKFSKSIIVLFSETIWIYYILALFISVEWNEATFVSATWWMVAGASGYIVHVTLAERVNDLVMIMTNLFILTFLLIQNWKHSVPEGAWIFGIFLTIAVAYVFIRSASLVYYETTRLQMLHRFEGNIIIYVVIVLVFSINEWGNDLFHSLYLIAIFSSLLGMVLSLDGHDQVDKNKKVDVHRVGNSGWFTGVISILLISVVILCSLLFLPSIRSGLQTMGRSGFNSLVWIYQKFTLFTEWMIGLFPAPKPEGSLPDVNSDDHLPPEDLPEESLYSIPLGWVIGFLGVIVVSIIIWIFLRFLKQGKPVKNPKTGRVFKFNHSWWNNIWKSFTKYIANVKRKWRKKFSHFYFHKIYWYYYQVQRWGKKNGIPSLPTETSKEYIERMIQLIEQEHGQEMNQLRNIYGDFEATYYGNRNKNLPYHREKEYKYALKLLKKMKMKS